MGLSSTWSMQSPWSQTAMTLTGQSSYHSRALTCALLSSLNTPLGAADYLFVCPH